MKVNRSYRGRFKKKQNKLLEKCKHNIDLIVDHNYASAHLCNGCECTDEDCCVKNEPRLGKNVSRSGWRIGRRIVEFDVLLSGLKNCKFCGLGPVPLTFYTIVGELQRGLGGYLYVKCSNVDCERINIVPYGKTHREEGKTRGIPSFVVNTKLGTAMIDSLGGPVRVNNFLTTLNIKPINNKNLKVIERRAGRLVENVADKSIRKAAVDAFQKEMKDIAAEETQQAAKEMVGLVDDLGVCPLPDASPNLMMSFQSLITPNDEDDEDEWIDTDEQDCDVEEPSSMTSQSTPVPARPQKNHLPPSTDAKNKPGKRVCLASRLPCKTRTGMSCAVDTAWHKRGFDSLTSHTFFMSKSKYGNKVVKSIVSHRTCGTCKWWRRNRPDQPVREHRCVHDHSGSAKLMESVSGEKGVKELAMEGTPVEVIEVVPDSQLRRVQVTYKLPLGFHSVRYAEKCMQHRKRVQDKSQLPSSKRRRLILKQERAITQGAQEALEGVSYQSEIGYAEEVDIEKLPDPVPRGIFKPVKPSSGEPSYITFDLETTDLIRGGVMPHITQLAAVHVETGSAFERYIVPKVPITIGASEVTGIVMLGPNAMKVNGKPVQVVPIKQAFEDFFKWLELFSCVFLVAHNGKRFDFPVVVSTVARLGFLSRLLSLVTGFVDSLPLFRKVYPNRITYKQEELVKDILGLTYGAHDAVEDVMALAKLLMHVTPIENVSLFSFPVKDVYHHFLFNQEKAKNLKSLYALVANGVCKNPTAENIAGSGLQLGHLQTIFKREGEDGLLHTFTVKNSEGQPRVTNTKRTLESVIPKLVEYFKKNDK